MDLETGKILVYGNGDHSYGQAVLLSATEIVYVRKQRGEHVTVHIYRTVIFLTFYLRA